jgi:hypothetical protein
MYVPLNFLILWHILYFPYSFGFILIHELSVVFRLEYHGISSYLFRGDSPVSARLPQSLVFPK